MSVINETQIANLACTHVGAKLIPAGTLWTDTGLPAVTIRAVYHMLRRAELRRNCWRFSIRRTAIRPVDTNSKDVTFGTWSSGATYALNDIVTGSDGQIYQSRTASNTNHDPTVPDYTNWGLYFGPLMATEYVTTYSASITYALGDHSVGSNGTVYVSLANSNTNHDPVSDAGVHWAVAANQTPVDGTKATSTSFFAGEVVFAGANVYVSKINDNTYDPTVNSTYWQTMTTTATVALVNIVYPLGSGPYSDNATRNLFQVPNGFMIEAPQMPKAGSSLPLGAPSGLVEPDWEYTDKYIVSSSTNTVIPYRFSADIADPTQFDAMFVEGLAARIAITVNPRITQSGPKQQDLESLYKGFMGEARLKNAIEEGPTYPYEDTYITCRA